jgi:hypothetical protein
VCGINDPRHTYVEYYKESPPRMVNGPHDLDDLDDLDDLTETDYDVDEWFLEDESNDRD